MDKYDNWIIDMGLKIGYIRKTKGISQEVLAERAGITAGYLAQVEAPSSVQPVSLRTLFRIADALGVKPMSLLDFLE